MPGAFVSNASPVSRTLLVLCVNQGISASFSLSLSYRRLRTTSFRSIKGPQHHPILLLPSIFSSIRVFSNESAIRLTHYFGWPEYWSFIISISLSNEYSGLISFRIDWFDLLAVQRTLKSLLQQHSSKASILQRSAVH